MSGMRKFVFFFLCNVDLFYFPLFTVCFTCAIWKKEKKKPKCNKSEIENVNQNIPIKAKQGKSNQSQC